MPGRNTIANDGEVIINLRPGISLRAEAGIELAGVEFGTGHCAVLARHRRSVSEPKRRVNKRKDGRLFILTLD